MSMFSETVFTLVKGVGDDDPRIKLPFMGVTAACGLAAMCEPVPADIRPWCLITFFLLVSLARICTIVAPGLDD